MNARIRILVAVFALFAVLVAPPCGRATAQGGKAEPARVRFPRGKTGTVLKGQLRADWQAEYAIVANQNQTMTFRLDDTPPGSLTLQVMDPDGADLPLTSDGKRQWHVALPKTGEYQFWVKRTSGKPGVSRYALAVTIR